MTKNEMQKSLVETSIMFYWGKLPFLSYLDCDVGSVTVHNNLMVPGESEEHLNGYAF